MHQTHLMGIGLDVVNNPIVGETRFRSAPVAWQCHNMGSARA
jgi:hypothetical protein